MRAEMLFGIKLKILSREVQLFASQQDDGRVVITTIDGDRRIDVRLGTEHAIGLGAALLDTGDSQQVAEFAARMDPAVAERLASALFAPGVARALLAAAMNAGAEAS